MTKFYVYVLALVMAAVSMSSAHGWSHFAACYQAVPTGNDCGTSQFGPLLDCIGCVQANCPNYGCSHPGYIIQSTPIKDCQLQVSGLVGFIGCNVDQTVYAVRYNYGCNEVTKCIVYLNWSYVGVGCTSDLETGDRCIAP